MTVQQGGQEERGAGGTLSQPEKVCLIILSDILFFLIILIDSLFFLIILIDILFVLIILGDILFYYYYILFFSTFSATFCSF